MTKTGAFEFLNKFTSLIKKALVPEEFVNQVLSIYEKRVWRGGAEVSEVTLEIVCTKADHTIKALVAEKPRSIIITSGSLPPFMQFKDETGLLEDIITYKGGHVINPEQVSF